MGKLRATQQFRATTTPHTPGFNTAGSDIINLFLKSCLWINTFIYWLLVFCGAMWLIKIIIYSGAVIDINFSVTFVFSTGLSILFLLLCLAGFLCSALVMAPKYKKRYFPR